MKISFINYNHLPQIKIRMAYLISAIEKHHKVGLIDATFHQRNLLSYVKKKVKRQKPDVIGFYPTGSSFVVSLFSFPLNLKIAEELKKMFPDIPMIWGGIHPTLMPEEVIKNPLVDAICIGEGEMALREYLDSLEVGKEPKVRGIWYKDNGNIIKNPPRPYIKNIDSLPFPNWDYWEIERYLKTQVHFLGTLPIMASRGCPFNCTFCTNPALRKAVPGKWYRTRNPSHVIEEIKINREKYWKKGFRVLKFHDEIFGLDKKQFTELCRSYVEEGLHEELPWGCQTRTEIITKSWAKRAAKAGCAYVTISPETGNDYIRNRIFKKGMTNNQIRLAVKNLKENGIMYEFCMLFGGPWETEKTVRESIELIKELNPIFTYINPFMSIPKTELAKKYGTDFDVKKIIRCVEQGILIHLKQHRFKIWKMRTLKLLREGFEMRGLSFITDVIKYLLSVDGRRVIPLTHAYLPFDLLRNTIYKYHFQDWRMRKAKENMYAE